MHSFFAAALLAAVPTALAAVPADLVTNLPGYGPPPTKTYSGYLDLAGGKHLHYYLALSQSNASRIPLAIWFNGGYEYTTIDTLWLAL